MSSQSGQLEYSYSNACRLALSIFMALERTVRIAQEPSNVNSDREVRFLETAKGPCSLIHKKAKSFVSSPSPLFP